MIIGGYAMKRIYILLAALLLIAIFSYYGANLIYRHTGKNADKSVIYKEYSEYVPEDKSVETGIMNKHGSNNITLSYVIGEPEESVYPYEYYLKDYDNHIAIFNKQGSLYEYTGIVLNGLDEDTRQNITKGIYFKEIEDLFTFLESYSS